MASFLIGFIVGFVGGMYRQQIKTKFESMLNG